ncbi:MAG: MoaD family protein [Dehalococcoidia bacterium]|jgi:molybdopterin synthase sulfur carrier subunit|nr:MoaD family protein [Dehalococcoidia bacterium]
MTHSRPKSLQVRLFATLREPGGGRAVEVTPDGSAPMRAVLELVFARRPQLRSLVLDEYGQVQAFVNVFVNGRSIVDVDGLDTLVNPEDRVAIFPPVAGGNDDELVLRGVPLWLLREYLAAMGAAEQVAGKFAGEGWSVRMREGETPTTGTLRLTPIHVEFAGEREAVVAARETFMKKAMRGGG